MQMLGSVMLKNLANYLFSTLLFVVLVSYVFIGRVSFVGNVRFGLEKGCQVSFFFISKFFIRFHTALLVKFLPLAKYHFYLIYNSFWHRFSFVVFFLAIANIFIESKIYSRWIWCSLSIKQVGVP